MRSALALLCSLSLGAGAWLTLPASVRAQAHGSDRDAQPSGQLSVSREDEAAGCPDTEELAARVARLRGQPATGTPGTYLVTFRRHGGVLQAAIRTASGSVRVLTDRGPQCASLAQATAVTLALLLDSDGHEAVVEAHPPEPRLQPTASPVPHVTALRPSAPRRQVALTWGLGGGALLGVVRTVAPAALTDLGLYVHRFHGSVGMLWVPKQRLDLAPGQLHETVLGGVARTCYAPFVRVELRFEACTGVYAGRRRVEASGYTRNDALGRTWLAVPLELSLSRLAPPFGVELGASALLPLRQTDFGIDDLGAAYESWPAGMLLTLRAMGVWVL